MFIGCNGLPVLSGELVMPRIGAWIGELALDGDPPTGHVEISVADGAVKFVGTALDRPGKIVERTAIQIVGGAGGLAKELPHKQHRGVPLSVPLGAILTEAGETLSPTSDATVLGVSLPSWSRRAGSAGEAIAELISDSAVRAACGGMDAAWRVLADGTVWVGRETWPELDVAAQVLVPDPAQDIAEVATDLPLLRPGVTHEGRRISAVTHRFEPDRVRALVHYERGDNAFDRLKAAFVGAARAALSYVDYHASYAATVIRQQGNGDLEVRIDDERFASLSGTGTAGVKLWPGVPGVSYTLRKGARVLLGFLDGRPRVPITNGWNSGTPERTTFDADRLELGAAAVKGVNREGDTVTVLLPPATLVGTAVIGGIPTPISGMVIWSPGQTMGNTGPGSVKVKTE